MKSITNAAHKLKEKIGKINNSFTRLLLQPDLYIEYFHDKKEMAFLFVCIFITTGCILNSIWAFPYYFLFIICFIVIFTIDVISLNSISKTLKYILSSLINQEITTRANYIYLHRCKKNLFNIIIPICVVLIFGTGGCHMFNNIELTPTFFWVMVLFCITVYISIVLYLQYVYLAIYIFNLSKSEGTYKYISKSIASLVPAETEWVKELAKISLFIRNMFFTVGSMYIIAFGGFCFLPDFGANISSKEFYILWIIIFFSIVITFPVVSYLEFKWIKNIVTSLKNSFIIDLYDEWKIISLHEHNLSNQVRELIRIISSIQIIHSRDYPIKTAKSNFYSGFLAVFNFTASMFTILQFFNISLSALLHIF